LALNILQHRDAGAFLRRAEEWLLQEEAENNMLLSVAYLLERGAKPFRQPAFLATVEEHDQVCGCVICPPPDGVYMTAIPPSAVEPVSARLRAMFDRVPELLGPEPAATLFAAQWAPDAWRINNRFRRYRLDRLGSDAKAASGHLRLGQASDLPVLEAWAADYRREARANPDIAELFRIMLERQSLFVWDDDGARCVVTASGYTPNGARISSTYTPPAFRRSGYARSAVAAVCRKLLESGRRFCVIVADVDEAAPNAVYSQIGFQPDGEILLIHFPASSGPMG
jgi:uncharacterized protein